MRTIPCSLYTEPSRFRIDNDSEWKSGAAQSRWGGIEGGGRDEEKMNVRMKWKRERKRGIGYWNHWKFSKQQFMLLEPKAVTALTIAHFNIMYQAVIKTHHINFKMIAQEENIMRFSWVLKWMLWMIYLYCNRVEPSTILGHSVIADLKFRFEQPRARDKNKKRRDMKAKRRESI